MTNVTKTTKTKIKKLNFYHPKLTQLYANDILYKHKNFNFLLNRVKLYFKMTKTTYLVNCLILANNGLFLDTFTLLNTF